MMFKTWKEIFKEAYSYWKGNPTWFDKFIVFMAFVCSIAVGWIMMEALVNC